jgi:hypothetical protein
VRNFLASKTAPYARFGLFRGTVKRFSSGALPTVGHPTRTAELPDIRTQRSGGRMLPD